MENDQQLIELMDSYLKGELSRLEAIQFEKRCAEDSALKGKFIEHQSFIDHLASYGKRKQFLADLRHAEEHFFYTSAPIVGRKISSIKKLWDNYRSHFAVAASVALLAISSTLLISSHFSDKGDTSYSILRREVNNLKRSQNALMKNINDKSVNHFDDSGRFRGTGFAISANGHVITNYHVVQGADSIYIQNGAGFALKVKQVYVDPTCDLAVLEVVDGRFKGFGNLPYSFKAAASDMGEDVYTIGFPDDKSVYGRGYLSSLTGYAGDNLAYQVSIPVNPGNSGGPLLDSQGNVIGVISGKQTHVDGAAFAIKSKVLLKSIETISQDHLERKLILSKKNTLAKLNRKDQIKRLQDYIFMVKVY